MAMKILKALWYGQRCKRNPTVHVVSSHGLGKYLKCIPIYTRDPRLENDQKFLVKVPLLEWRLRRVPMAEGRRQRAPPGEFTLHENDAPDGEHDECLLAPIGF